MKKWFVGLMTVYLVVLNGLLAAQSHRVDSLRMVLERDTANFPALMEMAKTLVDLDNVEALTCAKRAKALANVSSDTAQIVFASRTVGQLYNRLGDVNMAIKELAPLLIIAERNGLKNETKKITNSLAISFNNLGEFDKALEYHLKSLMMKEKDDDWSGVAVSLNNIGLVYYRMENYARALHYWEKCLDLKLATKDGYDLDALYLNLGLCFKELGKFEEAQRNLEKVLTACLVGCSNRIKIHSEWAIGDLDLKQNRFESAKNHLRTSLSLATEENDLEYKIENLLTLAQVSFKEHDLRSVEVNLKGLSELKGKEQFAKSLQQYFKLSSDYYFERREFQLANDFQRKYSQQTEVINNADMNRRLMEIQVNFVERENAEKLRQQQMLLESQSKLIEKQYLINFLLLGSAILSIGLAVLFFKLNVKKNTINRKLDRLVKERTLELENSRNELVHSCNEQRIVLEKISGNLSSSLATIKGLSIVAKLENFDNAQYHFRNVEGVLKQTVDSIKRLEIEPQKKI